MQEFYTGLESIRIILCASLIRFHVPFISKQPCHSQPSYVMRTIEIRKKITIRIYRTRLGIRYLVARQEASKKRSWAPTRSMTRQHSNQEQGFMIALSCRAEYTTTQSFLRDRCNTKPRHLRITIKPQSWPPQETTASRALLQTIFMSFYRC